MKTIKNNLVSGFLTRVRFKAEYAEQFSAEGSQIVETIYPEREDIYEFIDFCIEMEQFILDATILTAEGKVYSQDEFPTYAEE